MAKLEIKGLSVEELTTELDKMESHLYSLSFSNALSALENTSEIKAARRNVARIKTELRARELAGSTVKRDKIRARRRLAKKIKK
jgi:large subunit ribosomal protein L29